MFSCLRNLKGALRRIFGQPYFRSPPAILSAFLLIQLTLIFSPVGAQSQTMQAGEAFLTRFSGLVNDGAGFTLNQEGVVGSIFDLSQLGASPQGQKLDGNLSRLDFKSSQLGQVFGIAIDPQTADIYLSASSAYGLFRNGDNSGWMAGMWGPDGGPGTIWKLSASNDYEPEHFADVLLDGRANSGASLGNLAFDAQHRQLFVSDLETGMIHRFGLDGTELGRLDHGQTSRTAFTDKTDEGLTALDPVAFNPATLALVASCPFGAFAEAPSCWNYADFRRRVFGLGVRKDASTGTSRLFYSVWGSQGFGHPAWASAPQSEKRNSVWSIALATDGGFDASDIRREAIMPDMQTDPAELAAKGPSHPVSDIAFPVCKAPDTMLLSERAGIRTTELGGLMPPTWLNEARLLRYRLDGSDPTNSWQLEGHHDVGFPQRITEPLDRANDLGGVSFGYGYDASGKLDKSKTDQFIWTSGDQLCTTDHPCFDLSAGTFSDAAVVDGMQGFSSNAPTGPSTTIPNSLPAKSYMLDADGDVSSPQLGLMGDVEILQTCSPGGIDITDWRPSIIVPDAPWWDPGPWPDWPDPDWPDEPYRDLELTKDPMSSYCVPGMICGFTITVTNVGTEDFDGPIYLTDSLPNGTAFAGNSAPWSCALPGMGTHIACYHPPVHLAPGDHVELRILVMITVNPNLNRQEIENCARIRWMMDLPPNTLVIEAALAMAGYPVGPIDGIIDPATFVAIQQYQLDHGMPATGVIDAALRNSLLGGASGTADINPANDRDCAIVPLIRRDQPQFDHIPRHGQFGVSFTLNASGTQSCTPPNCSSYNFTAKLDKAGDGNIYDGPLYDGPLTLNVSLPPKSNFPNAGIVSGGKQCGPSAWVCSRDAEGLKCSADQCRMQVGESIKLGFDGKVAPELTKPPKTEQSRTLCGVLEWHAGSSGDANADAGFAKVEECVTTRILAEKPQTVVPPIVPPTVRKPCPPGWVGDYYPNCRKPEIRKRCPKGWHGTYQPNCRKPTCKERGLKGAWPKCYKPEIRKRCPKGWHGTYQPNCRKPTCKERGLKGAWPKCYKPEIRKRCPKGWHGTYQPNCRKPTCKERGLKGVWPKCYKPEVRKPCPRGWHGKYQPNCRKPTCKERGLKGAWPKCYKPRPITKPLLKVIPGKIKRICPKGQVNVNGRCIAPIR